MAKPWLGAGEALGWASIEPSMACRMSISVAVYPPPGGMFIPALIS
jgi:hypothetical protein